MAFMASIAREIFLTFVTLARAAIIGHPFPFRGDSMIDVKGLAETDG